MRNTLEPNLGLTGTGQEVSIMRSTLIRKNILVTEEDGITRINLKTGDENFDHMLSVIAGFVQAAKREGNEEFSKLYAEPDIPSREDRNTQIPDSDLPCGSSS